VTRASRKGAAGANRFDRIGRIVRVPPRPRKNSPWTYRSWRRARSRMLLADSPRRLLYGNKTIRFELDINGGVQWDTTNQRRRTRLRLTDARETRETRLLPEKHRLPPPLPSPPPNHLSCWLMSRCRVFRPSHAKFSESVRGFFSPPPPPPVPNPSRVPEIPADICNTRARTHARTHARTRARARARPLFYSADTYARPHYGGITIFIASPRLGI